MTTKIHDSVLTTVGHTPLIRLGRLNKTSAEILAKVEFFNPGGSVKDRVGLAMIEEAEKNGQLAPEGLIIEPTSGNTGVGLALAAAVKGYRLILTMPETMSRERRALLAAFGAQIVLTDGALGMKGAIDKARDRLCHFRAPSMLPKSGTTPKVGSIVSSLASEPAERSPEWAVI